MFRKIINMGKVPLCRPKTPLDYHTWIFSSVDNNNFNYNSKYLFLYVMEHHPEITPLFVIDDPGKRRGLSEKYGMQYFVDSQSTEGLKKILSAGVWFTSAGLPAYELTGDPRRIVVNLWHGIPLKKIVLMEQHAGRFQKLYFHRMFSGKYTDIVTTSRHLAGIMARSFGVSETIIQVWGQPRSDAILQGMPRGALRGRMGIAEEDAKLILYAPTYRDYGAVKLFPFPDLDAEALNAFLSENHIHIGIRMHLQESGSERPAGSNIHFVNEDVIDDIAEWMGCFDALITDYSSIYLDYLLLDRPMMFFPYDKERYFRERGMNFPYEKVTPGPHILTQREFLDSLEELLRGEDGYGELRAQCSRFFNQVTEPCCPAITRHILQRIQS